MNIHQEVPTNWGTRLLAVYIRQAIQWQIHTLVKLFMYKYRDVGIHQHKSLCNLQHFHSLNIACIVTKTVRKIQKWSTTIKKYISQVWSYVRVASYGHHTVHCMSKRHDRTSILITRTSHCFLTYLKDWQISNITSKKVMRFILRSWFH